MKEAKSIPSLKETLKEIKSRSTRIAMLIKEAPELPGILEEFELSLALVTGQLSPLLASIV